MSAPPALRRAFQDARSEFKEMSIGQLKDMEVLFTKYDTTQDGFLDLMELKYLMEQIGHPQTHLGLKAMIREVDEDNDGMIAYREFLLIFRYAKTGQLQSEGLKALAGSVDVQEVGVGGAKSFFEQKAKATLNSPEEMDRAYHQQKKKEAEEAKQRKASFKDRAAMFQ